MAKASDLRARKRAEALAEIDHESVALVRAEEKKIRKHAETIAKGRTLEQLVEEIVSAQGDIDSAKMEAKAVIAEALKEAEGIRAEARGKAGLIVQAADDAAAKMAKETEGLLAEAQSLRAEVESDREALDLRTEAHERRVDTFDAKCKSDLEDIDTQRADLRLAQQAFDTRVAETDRTHEACAAELSRREAEIEKTQKFLRVIDEKKAETEAVLAKAEAAKRRALAAVQSSEANIAEARSLMQQNQADLLEVQKQRDAIAPGMDRLAALERQLDTRQSQLNAQEDAIKLKIEQFEARRAQVLESN